MKKVWVVVVLLLLFVVGFLVLNKKKSATSEPADSTLATSAGGTNSLAPSVSAQNQTVLAASTSTTNNSTVATKTLASNITTNAPELIETNSLPPATVLDNTRVILHNYQSRFGENPVGDNAEITAALTGNNPKQVNFIAPESGLRLNDKGELIDGWGTPFFFHALSGKLMEIRSAGPDRKMWTLDDLVTR